MVLHWYRAADHAWQDKLGLRWCALFAHKHNRKCVATCRPRSTLTTQLAALGCTGCSLRSYGVSVIQRLCTYGSGWQPVMKNPQVSTYSCLSCCTVPCAPCVPCAQSIMPTLKSSGLLAAGQTGSRKSVVYWYEGCHGFHKPACACVKLCLLLYLILVVLLGRRSGYARGGQEHQS